MASLKDWILSLSPEQQHYIARLVASMPESEGGLGLPLKNTAIERQIAQNYDVPIYKGMRHDVTEMSPNAGEYARKNTGTWGSSDPYTASTYAGRQGGVIFPMVARSKDYATLDALKNNWNALPLSTNPLDSSIIKNIGNQDINLADILPSSRHGVTDTNIASQVARQAGAPGLAVKNVKDIGGYHSGTDLGKVSDYATSYSVFDPSTLRSRFAAFNPWMKSESNLLASHPLASAGAALAATGGLSGMAKEYLSQPMYQGPEMARVSKYTGVYPITRLENLKNTLSALPVTGEILAGAEGLQAASEGKWGEAGLGALGALPMMGGMIKASRSTVKNPLRKAFPGIYEDPRDIVNASAEMVAPENPMMRQLFGVSRADLDALTRSKAGQSSVDVPVYQPTARAAQHVENITKPANTRRVSSILEIASEDPRFAGSYGWYEAEPLLKKYVSMFGEDEGMRRFKQHHALGAALSPSTDVPTEIKRASIANQLLEAGRLKEFIDKSAVPPGAGHAYHTTAHAAGLNNLIKSGLPFPEPLQQAPKVRNYYYSRTGENTANPTIDAHMARQIGLADVRPKPNFGSVGAEENMGVKNWFNSQVANPLGMEGSPAQALLWNAAGKQSGVETALGAPYLELLTAAVQKQAARSGKSPQTVLDEFLAGKGHLW